MQQTHKKAYGTTGIVEKVCYGMGELGFSLTSSLITSFIMLYYTDSVLLSALYAGSMMAVCRFFDAVSDIIMGAVIEKTHTRWGKARPWVLFSALPFFICTVLVFHVPENLEITQKNIYVFITYFLMTVIVQTMFLMGYHSMLPRISLDSNDRNRITSVRVFLQSFALLAVSVITNTIVDLFGGTSSARAWSRTAIIYGFISVVLILVAFCGTKEKITITESSGNKKKESLTKGMKTVLKEKYFYISVIQAVIGSMLGAILISAGIYYAREVIGNADAFGVLVIAYMIPTMLGVAISPKIMAKVSKRKIVVICCVCMALLSSITFINPSSIVVASVSVALRAIFNGSVNVAQWTFASDLVEYIEARDGERYEGFATMANSFGQKVGQGLGTAIVGIVLSFGGYDGALLVQPGTVRTAAIFLIGGLPIILSLLMGIDMCFWDIEKRMKK